MSARRLAVVGLAVMSLAVAGTVSGCSSESDSSAADSASSASASPATPTPAPTPPAVVWAGQYCRDRAALEAAVSGFGRDLTISTSGDILDQVNKQLRGQALQVADALSHTITTLAVVPPELPGVQSSVQSVISAGTTAQEDIAALGEQITAVTQADNVIAGGLEAAKAVGMAKTTYDQLRPVVDSVMGLAGNEDPQLQEAMAQAPDCQGG